MITRETEKTEFLNRIIEMPDDNTVRLVYADWLDENDEPKRAKFIRAEIPGATAEGGASDLREQHGKEWVAEAGCNVRGVARGLFRHGFIEEIQASADAFVRHGATWATEVVDVGTWQGERSHPISVRLSPLHVRCVLDPKVTLEDWWQSKKCFGGVGR